MIFKVKFPTQNLFKLFSIFQSTQQSNSSWNGAMFMPLPILIPVPIPIPMPIDNLAEVFREANETNKQESTTTRSLMHIMIQKLHFHPIFTSKTILVRISSLIISRYGQKGEHSHRNSAILKKTRLITPEIKIDNQLS